MTILSNSFAVTLAGLTVACTGLVFASSARAEPAKTFKVAFHYSAGAPAAVTYADIKEQAVKACRRESGALRHGPIGARFGLMQLCQNELVDKAVTAIGKRELSALHDNTGTAGGQIAVR